MPEMHLRQLGLAYTACILFTNNKESIQKFKETWNFWYIYQNKLDKAFFQHGIAYRDFKDSTRRTSSDKILRDKAFDIAKHFKYDCAHTSIFAKKVDKAGLKSEIDKLDIGKLKGTLVDLSKLSDAVKNEVIKKDWI